MSRKENEKNSYGQTLGPRVKINPQLAPPVNARLLGQYCRVVPLDVDTHAEQLHQANHEAEDGRFWTYLSYGPFDDLGSYRAWLEAFCLGDDPIFYAVIDSATELALGIASYLRASPEHGSVEVGHINYAPRLQRTRAATEAMYLMMAHVFEMGYRRYEWKCNALNGASREAALRLGFTFEGVHRQNFILKGRSRDTAWYSIIDSEWPCRQREFERWLSPDNFNEDGQQLSRLHMLP